MVYVDIEKYLVSRIYTFFGIIVDLAITLGKFGFLRYRLLKTHWLLTIFWS